MDLLRSIVVFLLGAGAAMGAYFSGAFQAMPDYFSQWSSPVAEPVGAPPVTAPPVVAPPVVTQPVIQPVAEGGYDNGDYPPADYQNGGNGYPPPPYPGAGAPPPVAPVPVPAGPIGYTPVRLKVRCNVHPREIPYGCAAAYGVINNTPNQVVIAFEDPRGRGGPDVITVVRPGEAIAGDPYRRSDGPYYSDLRRREKHFSYFKPGERNAPPFIIELKECGVNDPKCGVLY